MNQYQIRIDVTVNDRAQLAAFAKSRAIGLCGLSEDEYTYLEQKAYEHEGEEGFWLGWVFDAGTPPNSGIQIEDSEAIFTA